MTNGQILKKKLSLNKFPHVKIRRLVTGGSLKCYQIVFDSRNPLRPITTFMLRKNKLIPKIVNGNANTFFGTPWADLENFNGILEVAIFFVSDLSGVYGKPNNYSEKYYKYSNKLEELTIQDLQKVDFYTSDITQKYKDIRKSYQGQGVKNTKLIETKYIEETGSLRFIFLTEATEISKNKQSHKMTTAKIDIKQQFDVNSDSLIDNPSKTYDMFLQLENVFPNKSYSDISWLEVYNGEEINSKMMKDLLEVADVKLWDNTPAFQFQGFAYRLTQMKSSIFPENRPDSFWRKKHGNEGLLDKHWSQLFASGTIQVLLNQMTSALIKVCKEKGFAKNIGENNKLVVNI